MWRRQVVPALIGSMAALLAGLVAHPSFLILSALLATCAALAGRLAQRESDRELDRLRGALLVHHRDNAIGQVVAAAAHDIKNPLTVAMGFAELARTSAEETRAVPPKLVRWLKDVENECQRTAQLINDLLQFARGEEQDAQPRKTNDWVRAAVGMVKPQIRLKGSLLLEEYAENPGEVMGDHHQLRYLILNLMLNARDAVPEGGKVTVKTFREGAQTVVRIEDDGPGMPRAVRDAPFTPYLSGRPEGAGLGLAVSRELARAHGGTLAMEALQPHGTALILRLPTIVAEEEPTSTARSA